MKKLLKRFKESKKGFSLVELIVVIAIMAILVGVLGVTFIPYIERSREGVDIDTLGKVKSVVEPAVLTDESILNHTKMGYKLSTVEARYKIVAESLPDVESKCQCEDDLECYIYINEDGTVEAYFSADDGKTAFEGTKSGDALATGALPKNITIYEAPADDDDETP